MKRILLVAMGVAALALVGCAGSKEEKRGVEKTASMNETTTEGTVVAVEEDTITVRDAKNPQGQTLKLRRTSDTDLVRDDRPFSWTEISQGMPVRVSYEADSGPGRATRVEVLTGSEAEQVRNKAGGSWQKPEGITRPRGQGGPPPVDRPSGDGGTEGNGMEHDSSGDASESTMDSMETNE